MKIEEICNSRVMFGGSPHWDPISQRLYYLCKNDGLICSYDYNTQAVCRAKIDFEPNVSFIIPIAKRQNEYVAGLGKRVAIINWNGQSAKAKVSYILCEIEKNDIYNDVCINFGKVDMKGRLYFTSHFITRCRTEKNECGSKSGTLYRFINDAIKRPQKICDFSGVLNDISWDYQNIIFYTIDTWNSKIIGYEYKIETMDMINGFEAMSFCDFENGQYIIRGLTTDANGFLFGYLAGTSSVVKINPLCRKVVEVISLPPEYVVTSIIFGSPFLCVLYVFALNVIDKEGKLFQIKDLNTIGIAGERMVLEENIN